MFHPLFPHPTSVHLHDSRRARFQMRLQRRDRPSLPSQGFIGIFRLSFPSPGVHEQRTVFIRGSRVSGSKELTKDWIIENSVAMEAWATSMWNTSNKAFVCKRRICKPARRIRYEIPWEPLVIEGSNWRDGGEVLKLYIFWKQGRRQGIAMGWWLPPTAQGRPARLGWW
jgi:hypothetical protein